MHENINIYKACWIYLYVSIGCADHSVDIALIPKNAMRYNEFLLMIFFFSIKTKAMNKTKHV
ncbi:hypothetical protein ETAR_23980 [Edwardsiella tarda]|nr:hypothetical protein GBS0709_32000 [Edwardsiella tarda]